MIEALIKTLAHAWERDTEAQKEIQHFIANNKGRTEKKKENLACAL